MQCSKIGGLHLGQLFHHSVGYTNLASCWLLPHCHAIPYGAPAGRSSHPWFVAVMASLVLWLPGLHHIKPACASISGTLDGPPIRILRISTVLGQIHHCGWPWTPLLATVLIIGIHVGSSGHALTSFWCTRWISHGCNECGMSEYLDHVGETIHEHQIIWQHHVDMGNAKINWLLGWEATRLLASLGWLKSCTTKDDDYPDPIIYRVLYIPGGAGFLPSTVAGHPCRSFLERENTHIDNHKHVRKKLSHGSNPAEWYEFITLHLHTSF